MPSESNAKITRNLFLISFALWFVALVILGRAVFDMDIAVYNATCDLVNFCKCFCCCKIEQIQSVFKCFHEKP